MNRKSETVLCEKRSNDKIQLGIIPLALSKSVIFIWLLMVPVIYQTVAWSASDILTNRSFKSFIVRIRQGRGPEGAQKALRWLPSDYRAHRA